MFHRQRASKSIAQPGEQRAQGSPGVPAPALRVSALVFALLSSVPLGIGILISLPPAQLAEGLKALIDLRDHIGSNAGGRLDLAQPPAAKTSELQSERPARVAPPVPVSHGGNVLAYGDRLKMTFYETLGVTLDARGDMPSQAVTTVYPRMDLSAEYTVDEDGLLAIPKLGQFKAVGETLAGVQSVLEGAFEKTVGRPSDVRIETVDRQPIYVLGTVRNAGTFKHRPGMTVLQALADAGGFNTATADTSRAIENIRETQRLRQAVATLDRLLVTQARLAALRQDAESIVVPSSILSRLAASTAPDSLNAIVVGAQATLAVERTRYRQQVALAERQVKVAGAELQAQTMRADQLGALMAKKSDRLRKLEGIAAHGSVPQFKLTDVGADVSEIAARREDARVAVAQSERRVVEAEIALAKIQLDHTAGIDKDLAATQQEIDDCTQAVASMQAVTQVLRDSGPGGAGDPVNIPVFRITRRVADGLTVMFVTESTALLPGDVVQVNFPGRFDERGAGSIQNVTQLQN